MDNAEREQQILEHFLALSRASEDGGDTTAGDELITVLQGVAEAGSDLAESTRTPATGEGREPEAKPPSAPPARAGSESDPAGSGRAPVPRTSTGARGSVSISGILTSLGVPNPADSLASSPLGSVFSGGDAGQGVASRVLSGLSPLISGIIRLFGGGSPAEPPPLVRYSLPASMRLDRTVAGAEVADVDYDQMGMPRAVSRTGAQNSGGVMAIDRPVAPSGGSPAQTINLTVQALDSQSFLDRSHEIARAVREAMLNMNSINDVVNDL